MGLGEQVGLSFNGTTAVKVDWSLKSNQEGQVKKQIGGWIVILMVAGLVSVLSATGSESPGKESHPELSAQEMLIACADCHRETTPEVTQEWYDSLHGIGMVKCYQCHGTFETFTVTPSRETCGTCHTARMAKYKDNTPCWECHTPHTFKNSK